MTKEVILTGIRANSDLHIGNYFGAMLPMIDMAKIRSSEYQINMFIPDLHSFTTPIDHTKLYDSILNNARVYVASGLPIDNENIFLYRQSRISAHSELAWILDCFTGFGEMRRMTQFKEKSKQSVRWTEGYDGEHESGSGSETVLTENGDRFKIPSGAWDINVNIDASVGLFNYPVLMASDILLYNAKYVPVGDDQTQHLEFTRDIAERMNARFGELFVVPEPVKNQHEFFGKDQGLRIKDLADPTKKMSKSDESGKGVIFLTDTPEQAAKKIMSATTDDMANISYNKQAQPGISNLLEILALARQANGNSTTLAKVIEEFTGQTRYGDFKGVVAAEVITFLQSFQCAYQKVDMAQVEAKLTDSEASMRDAANTTLLKVQQAVGLRAT